MALYGCYFRSENGDFVAYKALEATSDTQALAAAADLLLNHSFEQCDIWYDGRIVVAGLTRGFDGDPTP